MSAVGIDVGKRSHEAGFLNGSGEPIGRSLRFANTASGVQALHERLQALPEAPTIALEASGQYWLGLQRRLAAAGYATHVINPLQARASRCRRRLCPRSGRFRLPRRWPLDSLISWAVSAYPANTAGTTPSADGSSCGARVGWHRCCERRPMVSPPNTRPARRPLLETATHGAVAGLTGSVVQAGVGYLIDRALLPRGHNNNIAPRLFSRLFQRTGRPPQPVRDWLFGTIFHELYGASWGVLQALAADRLRVPAAVLAPPLTGLIYLVAFSRFGVGTLTGAERHPDQRHRGKEASLLAVGAVFSIATSLVLYGWEQRNVRAGAAERPR